MKKSFIISCFLLIAFGISNGAIKPTRLTTEYVANPLAINILKPRLSWINTSDGDERGQVQTAWEIRVSATKKSLLDGVAELWKSGKVMSGESVNIVYNGAALVSDQKCWWQVRVWDKDGKMSDWSEPASWGMGLLNSGDWKASWIGSPWQDESPIPRLKYPGEKADPLNADSDPAPMLRKTFTVNKKIKTAIAHVTGLGYFEMYLNGEKVGNDVLSPDLTLYGKRADLGDIGVMIKNNFREYRVMYLTYDISDLLKQGENVAGAILGNGFYNPRSYWTQGYGSPRFIAQILIRYTDGTEQLVLSDQSWKVAKSPIVMDQIYDGEHYDARLEQHGWCSPGFNDAGWKNAVLRKAPEGLPEAQLSPADRVMERLKPVKIEFLGKGRYKIDFGQEISGWIHLEGIKGEAGQKIDIKYICESPVGTNSYIMKGGSPESYSPRFTWFVFSKVEISGLPGELKPDQVTAEAVYSNIETTGKFECSDTLFNKINKIWWRSQTDNMHGGIASDCPHRERSPYTGDGQVSCVTVMHNFDARSFYTKWIRDIWGAQNPENGYVPNGAPWQPGCGGGVAWGAAINIMPWEFYVHYGDLNILSTNFEAMKGYIKYMLTWTDDEGIMHSQAPDRKKPNQWINLGDWCSPGKLPPDEMVHTFYLWRCADLTAKAAKALGKSEEYNEYMRLASKTKDAFMKRFFNEEKGSYGPNGGNIFALKMGVPDNRKERVLSALKADIEANGGHLDTGIFGTQFFFEVLSDNGLNELAYEAMNKRTQPGYGWWIEQGATTTWEQWNGEGSRNHPMFGGGIVWFYRKLAGMNADPDFPGYKKIIFKPVPAREVTFASYSNLIPFGQASVRWEKKEKKFIMEISVPVGCTATVYIPASTEKGITESGKPVENNKEISLSGFGDGYARLSTGSGKYVFESSYWQDKLK
jgi:alpha-L-rhamnosidase